MIVTRGLGKSASGSVVACGYGIRALVASNRREVFRLVSRITISIILLSMVN